MRDKTEIICSNCGHPMGNHVNDGCCSPKTKYVHNTIDEMCECKLSPLTVEARYWARVMGARYTARVWWCQQLAKERDKLKTLLYDQSVELYKARKHYVDACVKLGELRRELQTLKDTSINENTIESLEEENETLRTSLDEYKEHLRMCQFTLRTMDEAHTELIGYTKIAVDAIKKALESGNWFYDYPSNTGTYNDLQEALSKIKGKF